MSDLTHKEFSSKGGKKAYEKQGPEPYRERQRKAVETMKSKDPAYGLRLVLKGLETRYTNGHITHDKYEALKAVYERKIEELEQ